MDGNITMPNIDDTIEKELLDYIKSNSPISLKLENAIEYCEKYPSKEESIYLGSPLIEFVLVNNTPFGCSYMMAYSYVALTKTGTRRMETYEKYKAVSSKQMITIPKGYQSIRLNDTSAEQYAPLLYFSLSPIP
jgi:hypothetical protein